MPERCPNDRGGGRGEIAGIHQPGLVGGTAGFDPEPEGARHRHGISGLGDRGVEQHGVVAELQRFCRMRGRAEAGIDDEGDVGQAVAQQLQRVAEPIGAAQGITTLQPASTRRVATERSSVQ